MNKSGPSRPSFKEALRGGAAFRPERTLWAWRYFVAVGAGMLCMVLVSKVVGPLISWGIFFGLLYVFGIEIPKRFSAWLWDDQKIVDAKPTSTDPYTEIFEEAYHHVLVLARARKKLPENVSAVVTKLHAHAKAITDQSFQNRTKFAGVMRFFTYYLPATSHLVADRLKLADHAGSGRLVEIDAMLARLVDAFEMFKKAALTPDLESVDMDMELLSKALSVELEELNLR
jgi:hypothetical protein